MQNTEREYLPGEPGCGPTEPGRRRGRTELTGGRDKWKQVSVGGGESQVLVKVGGAECLCFPHSHVTRREERFSVFNQ